MPVGPSVQQWSICHLRTGELLKASEIATNIEAFKDIYPKDGTPRSYFIVILQKINYIQQIQSFMRKFLLNFLACFVLGFTALSLNAATDPTVHAFKFDDKATISKMSDNGMWAVAYALNPSNTIFGLNPRLLNLSDNSAKLLTEGIDPAEIISAYAFDVTDKGDIVVGEMNLRPGYWQTATNTFVELPLAEGASGGAALAITPDGKYAVGNFTYENDSEEDFLYKENEALWDIENNKLIQISGLPKLDMANENKKQNRFIGISADGNIILGCMSISYLPTGNYAGGRSYYVYNLKEKSYKFIGFTPNDKGPWTPADKELIYIGSADMSNNGQWITGSAQMYRDIAGEEFDPEFGTPFLFNTQSNEFTLYNENTDNGVFTACATNDGVMLGATPDNNPYREWSIRNGQYWISIAQILKQKYNIDFIPATGLENTGTPLCISNDNRRVAVMTDPESSYVMTFAEDITTISNDIDLLGVYNVTPMAGSEISKLQKFNIVFDRDVEVLGEKSAVEIRNAAGQKIYSSIAFKSNAKMVNVIFRKGMLEAGQQYTLHIPAGSISLKGDRSKTNKEINIAYTGRTAVPVAMVKAVPENQASIAKIDAASSPILLTFDANVAIAEKAMAKMYRADEEVPFCDLMLGFLGKEVALYPANPQMLYKGANYKIVVPAGSITDVNGENSNEEIVLNYVGAFEREISSDDKILFKDNFDNGLTNFLMFDGDKNNPNDLMKEWGFADNINYPWSVVRDSETSEDMAAASHSMYDPSGKSNDWLVIPQTYIPDNLCVLKFQSQSYMKDMDDKLKVIVWASDNIYNVLNQAIIDKINQEGVVVYNQKQEPGENEDLMEGEWADNTIELRDFAGKNVYIAFVNENDSQSAVFLNNIEVLHNIPFLVTFDNETSVTSKSEIIIKGRITSDSETEVYTSATLTLKDATGKTIDVINNPSLNLKKGETFNFAFNQPLPLALGKVNEFSLDVKMNETENTIKNSVKNLSFEPVKCVVLEEYTGMSCPNCPLGILAIEKIKSIYGSRFLPIALHCYPGDQLGTGLENYSNYFSFAGAPSGVLQRSGVISSPMMSDGQDYTFNGLNGEKLWLDIVQEEMSTPADAEISATAKVNEDNTIEIPCTIRYAMDTENLNVNLFAAFVENDVIGFQQNNLSGISDPDLGKFGTGGEYGKSMIYPFYHGHVARGWYGNTIAGTAGLIPTTVEAGKDYVATIKTTLPKNIKDINKTYAVIMMIDANTERVINAIEIPVNGEVSGIEESTTNNVVVATLNHQVVVNTADSAWVEVYTAAGQKLGQTKGQGVMQMTVNGYRGVAIVKVSTAQNTIVKKVML